MTASVSRPLIEDEIARRGIKLRRSGHSPERVGPCPICGGRDRFSINTRKQLWNCRVCGQGGDVIDLVQHIDRCDYKAACETLRLDRDRPAPRTPPPPASRQDNDNAARAGKIWRAAIPSPARSRKPICGPESWNLRVQTVASCAFIRIAHSIDRTGTPAWSPCSARSRAASQSQSTYRPYT
jgi:CHC2 zinc finger